MGVTSDLVKCIFEHKNKLTKSFTQKYNVDKSGYFESCKSMEFAIMREKQLKTGKRQAKIDVIQKQNPQWDICMKHYFNRLPRICTLTLCKFSQ